MSRLLVCTRLLVCLAVLALPALAHAQTTTTTLGGTTTNSSGTYRLKQNRITVTQDAVLDSADFYFGSSGSVTVGVWEQTGSSGSYLTVFQQSLSIGSTSRTWRTMSGMNVPDGGQLVPGGGLDRRQHRLLQLLQHLQLPHRGLGLPD